MRRHCAACAATTVWPTRQAWCWTYVIRPGHIIRRVQVLVVAGVRLAVHAHLGHLHAFNSAALADFALRLAGMMMSSHIRVTSCIAKSRVGVTQCRDPRAGLAAAAPRARRGAGSRRYETIITTQGEFIAAHGSLASPALDMLVGSCLHRSPLTDMHGAPTCAVAAMTHAAAAVLDALESASPVPAHVLALALAAACARGAELFAGSRIVRIRADIGTLQAAMRCWTRTPLAEATLHCIVMVHAHSPATCVMRAGAGARGGAWSDGSAAGAGATSPGRQ